MFKVLGKLPWFEWVGIVSVIGALIFGAMFFTGHGRMEEDNKQLTKQTQDLSHLLLVEKKVAEVTDQAVFEYTFERDLKLQEAPAYQAQDLDAYFTTRDANTPIANTPKEKPHVVRPASRPKPTAPAAPKVVAVDDGPDPAAIAVLVAGMQRTYCRAYHDRATCPAADNADGVQTQPTAK
jgi:hypothetical protein